MYKEGIVLILLIFIFCLVCVYYKKTITVRIVHDYESLFEVIKSLEERLKTINRNDKTYIEIDKSICELKFTIQLFATPYKQYKGN